MLKRILMNVADGSPGSGAPAAPVVPAAPAAAPATPAAPAQGAAPLTREDLKSFAAEVQNGVFANLRRAGVLGNEQPKPKAGEGAPTTEVAAPAPDAMSLRRLDRALARSGRVLESTMYDRLEKLYAAEAPSDAERWVTEFFSGFGSPAPAAAAPAAAAPNPNPPATNPTGPTVSDRGAPAATKVPPEEANILTMSDADRKALIASKGLKWYAQKFREQMKGVRVSVR